MKRGMTGGTYRAPVGLERQRRAVRFVQLLLVLIAVALVTFAAYTWGRADGFEAGQRAGEIDAPRAPSTAQTVVLVALGAAALGGAALLQGPTGVRMPTPARLEELAGRAEAIRADRSEEAVGTPGAAEEAG